MTTEQIRILFDAEDAARAELLRLNKEVQAVVLELLTDNGLAQSRDCRWAKAWLEGRMDDCMAITKEIQS